MEDMTYEFTCKQGAVFKLRDLTLKDLAELEDGMVQPDAEGKMVPRMGSTKRTKFIKAVVGWSNLKRQGQDFPFSEEHKDLVPVVIYHEILDAVNKRMELSEAQEFQ